MNVAEADAFARHMLPILGLSDWAVVWMDGEQWEKIAAVTQPATKIIQISRALVIANDFATISEIVRHEAAHAMVPFDGHGDVWAAVAARFGCRFINAAGMIPMRMPGAADTELVTV